MISVIIPLFNKEKTIARCLESVIAQSYGNFECVVVDDGSTDNGASIVKSFNDSRIKYFYKKNGGVSSARNFGVAHAHADKIVFLDADDYFLVDALKILDDGMTLNHTVCAAANFYIGKTFSKFLFSRIKSGVIKDPFKLWYLNCFCPRTGSAIFKKNILQKYPFNENLCRYEDAEVLFNIMRENKFFYDKRPVMVYTDDFNELSFACSIPEKDFCFHMSFLNTSLWERMCLLHFLNAAYTNYPNKNEVLLNLYGTKKKALFFEKKLFLIVSKCSKILKLFRCLCE